MFFPRIYMVSTVWFREQTEGTEKHLSAIVSGYCLIGRGTEKECEDLAREHASHYSNVKEFRYGDQSSLKISLGWLILNWFRTFISGH